MPCPYVGRTGGMRNTGAKPTSFIHGGTLFLRDKERFNVNVGHWLRLLLPVW